MRSSVPSASSANTTSSSTPAASLPLTVEFAFTFPSATTAFAFLVDLVESTFSSATTCAFLLDLAESAVELDGFLALGAPPSDFAGLAAPA